MRSLIVTAIWLSMLIPSALAQTNSSSTTQSDRIDAAKRETADLEKARIIEQMRQSIRCLTANVQRPWGAVRRPVFLAALAIRPLGRNPPGTQSGR
jgi:hypothetical protein